MIEHQPIEILLLDDNKDDILATTTMLKDQKVDNIIHPFSSTVDALEFLRTRSVDVLFIDINLGPKEDGNGLDFISKAREEQLIKDESVVVMSGVRDDRLEPRADLLGVSVWLTKPLNVQKLHHLVLSIPEFFIRVVKAYQTN